MSVKKNHLYAALLLAVLAIASPVWAQDYQAVFKPSVSTRYGSQDLWNFDVISNRGDDRTVTLRNTLQSTKGEVLVESFSNSVLLRPGFNAIHSSIASGNVKYYQPQLEQSDRASRSFPPGSYLHCIEVIDPVSNEHQSLGCAPVQVQVLNPPMLVYPGNRNKIQEKHPLLTWLPPTPLADLSNVRYHLTLVEQYPKQQPGDALLRNRPVLYQKDILSNTLQYPFSSPALEYGKSYAWQVEATDMNGISYGVTETWSFLLGADSVEDLHISKDQSYIDIKTSDNRSIYYAVGDLRIKYVSKQFPSSIRYKLLTEDGKVIADNPPPLTVAARDNRYDIPVDRLAGLKHKQQYQIELTDDRRELYRLRFVYVDPLRIK